MTLCYSLKDYRNQQLTWIHSCFSKSTCKIQLIQTFIKAAVEWKRVVNFNPISKQQILPIS